MCYRWEEYCRLNLRGMRHEAYPNWFMETVWTFVRLDGLYTPQTTKERFNPFNTWRQNMEYAMYLADKYIPLHAELPAGMGTRRHPDFAVLWERAEQDEILAIYEQIKEEST
jgi:hypothetical protein